MVQITHDDADDEKLRELIGEPKTDDEAATFEAQQLRLDSVKLAISGCGAGLVGDLIANAAAIEAYVLRGHVTPETPQARGGTRAYVEDDMGAVREV